MRRRFGFLILLAVALSGFSELGPSARATASPATYPAMGIALTSGNPAQVTLTSVGATSFRVAVMTDANGSNILYTCNGCGIGPDPIATSGVATFTPPADHPWVAAAPIQNGATGTWSTRIETGVSPAPTATITATPNPAPTPVAISGAPCTVTISGVRRSGTCSGTFTRSTTPLPRISVDDVANRNYIPGLLSTMQATGVTWDRIDVGDGSEYPSVTAALALGIRPIVLYNVNMPATTTSTIVAQVTAIAQKMRSAGLTELEFGNEVYCNGCNGWSIDYPQTYAQQYAAVHAALAGTGITLLACATGDYQTATGKWSQDAAGGGWIHDFLRALPGGAATVDAWTAHPYGPMDTITPGDMGGWPVMQRWHDLAKQYGADKPWYVTEVGQALNATEYVPALTQQQQAAYMTQYLNDVIAKYPFITFWSWYEVTDDSSGQWGLVDVNTATNTLTATRTSYQALKTWMASHAAQVNG
jgi:hypothetical protein